MGQELLEEVMSIKTTQRITREVALSILMQDLPQLSNDMLGRLLDLIADSEQSKVMSRFDNFIVSQF
jgi:hypothetical protein